MTSPLLPPLKNYNLTPAQRKRFQLIIDGQDTDDTQLFFLNPYDKDCLQKIIADYLHALDSKQALLLDKLAQLTGATSNEQKHDYNSRKIANAVQHHILTHKAVPTYQQLAQQTGLARQTIAKHITEHINKPEETAAQYSYAAKGLMDMILHDALKHRNILAARIYLNALDKMTTKAAPSAQLTIAGTTITQQTINQLSLPQQQAILNILQPQAVLSQPALPQAEE